MAEVVPGVGNDRLETANQLVLALGAGIEALQAMADGVLHALVETGFEVQPIKLRQATPVAPIQAVAADQAKGHGYGAAGLMGQHHADHLRHAFGQQAEKGTGQVRRLAAYPVGIGVAQVDEIPLDFTQLMAFAPLELDTLPRHLLSFLAHLFALARTEGVEKILKIPVTLIAPVELTAQTLQPAVTAVQQGIFSVGGEVDMQARQALLLQPGAQAIEQLPNRLGRAQQALTGNRGEGNRAEQLGVIINAGAMAGIGPTMVEHILAIGVAFHIARHGRQ